MNPGDMLLTGPTPSPSVLKTLEQSSAASQRRKQQAAKDFESVLINRILEQMGRTIGQWGFEKDGVSKQVWGLFWFSLAQELAKQGGFGLWKDLCRFYGDSPAADVSGQSIQAQR